MKHTETFYAVELPSSFKGGVCLCMEGGQCGPKLFWFRGAAVLFKNILLKTGRKTARVVRVKASYTWNAKPL